MKISTTSLKSKVARRVFSLFIFCALVPISALAVISFGQVSKQLHKQNLSHLHQLTKSIGMSIFERLSFLEKDLRLFAYGIAKGTHPLTGGSAGKYDKRLKNRFLGISLVLDSGRCVPFFGHIEDPGELSEAGKRHLISGKALLFTRGGENNCSHVYMITALDPQDPKQGMIFGEISPIYLWNPNEYAGDPGTPELCVLDQSSNVIYSSFPVSSSFYEKSTRETSHSPLGHFEWKYGGKDYLATFWSIFLKFKFFCPSWTVVVSTSKDSVLAPMSYFKKTFPFVLLFSFLVVLLLSIIQIRRTLLPLEKLQDGTRRIAMGDFEGIVEVTSGDEFQELAVSFNDMAGQLGRQFNALNAMSEIDRSILSSLDTRDIIETVTRRIHDMFSSDFAGIILIDTKDKGPTLTYIKGEKRSDVRLAANIKIAREDIQGFHDGQEVLLMGTKKDLPPYLAPFAEDGIEAFTLIPFFVKDDLKGIIALGSRTQNAFGRDDLAQIHRLAAQVAVALSNARLMEELARLNWGSLSALARAVDAKSPWTAGHSERVTEIALKIGQEMGLTQDEMTELHQGGLLHDIGKIGVPASILDKPGRLTDEEYRVIQKHPETGARIMEPIGAFSHIMPLILQHHEWFDGQGYPSGLSGEDICLGARILAVADVYDALVSERPYRSGMELGRAIQIIKDETGNHFDPRVVEDFLKVITKEDQTLSEK